MLSRIGTVGSQLATRTLGRSDLEVSVLGLGCNQIGRTVDHDGTRRLIDECEAAGVNLVDTADTDG
jgi:aryl-alcohol dehydrogenase-like predicted oxidoreductase